jgi:hypothetical protein
MPRTRQPDGVFALRLLRARVLAEQRGDDQAGDQQAQESPALGGRAWTRGPGDWYFPLLR